MLSSPEQREKYADAVKAWRSFYDLHSHREELEDCIFQNLYLGFLIAKDVPIDDSYRRAFDVGADGVS